MKEFKSYITEKFRINKETNISNFSDFNIKEIDKVIDDYFSNLVSPLHRGDYDVSYEIVNSPIKNDNRSRLKIQIHVDKPRDSKILKIWNEKISTNIDKNTKYIWVTRTTTTKSKGDTMEIIILNDN